VLYWALESKEVHAKMYEVALEKFYKRWTRCLITMPKIILGDHPEYCVNLRNGVE